jgi:hypothetical protein
MIASGQQVQHQLQNHTAAIILRLNDSDTEFWRQTLSQTNPTRPLHPSTLFWGNHFAHKDRDKTFRQLEESTYVTSLYEAGWDGYDAPAPNQAAVASTLSVLSKMREESGLIPYSVLPSADGGVGISFRGQGNKRAVLELLNDGTASYMQYGKGCPTESTEFDSNTDLPTIFQRLGEYL